MVVLALDTSSTTASAALVTGGLLSDYIILAESSVKLNRPPTASETLMQMVDMLFKTARMTTEDVDYIACTAGPGSFTGLRIGAATAKGLAFGLDKPLIPVPTLDAMAYSIEGITVEGTCVVPMMDARRGQVYTAFYYEDDRTAGTKDYMAGDAGDLVEKLLGLLAGLDKEIKQIIFLGEGAEACQDRIKSFQDQMPKMIQMILAPPHYSQLQASSVGGLAINMAKKDLYIDESEFSLLYIRKPQAQREAEEKQRKS